MGRLRPTTGVLTVGFGEGVRTSTAVNPTYTCTTTRDYNGILTGTCPFSCSDVYQDIVEEVQNYITIPFVIGGYPYQRVPASTAHGQPALLYTAMQVASFPQVKHYPKR
ncbi:MAG: hypothetical protein WA996_02825, partial [Candidatus Promineifilaceae bacterium]